jgi:hypothetical protein
MNDAVIRRMVEDLRDAETTLVQTVSEMVSRGGSLQVLVHKAADLEAFSHKLALKAAVETRDFTTIRRTRIALACLVAVVICTVIIYVVFVT